MKTYQDFLKVAGSEEEKRQFIVNAISEHQSGNKYRMAKTAERYFALDSDINRYQKMITNAMGQKVPDLWSANVRIPTNWYFYFVVQSNSFLLSNGVQFKKSETKKKLGKYFDYKIKEIALNAKHGGCAYGFWNNDHLDIFSYPEFVPLYDEEDGALKAGIRFWQIDADKPLRATLYEIDGYTEYIRRKGETALSEKEPKRAYKLKVASYQNSVEEYLDGENYEGFPIVPLYNVNHVSELYGKKQIIDIYDLTLSTMANNSTQNELIYWVIKNCGGFESDEELQKVVDKIIKAKVVPLDDQSDATPHKIEPPFQANECTLKNLKDQLYVNFMGLHVEEIAAGAVTATQIKAAYEPLAEKCFLFKEEITRFLERILSLAGIDDTPSFIPKMIANTAENVQTLMMADQYFDDETMVKKLCAYFDFPDETAEILKKLDTEELQRTPIKKEDEEE